MYKNRALLFSILTLTSTLSSYANTQKTTETISAATHIIETCYFPTINTQEIETHHNCGTVTADNTLKISPSHLAKTHFSENQLACFYLGNGQTFYINTHGETKLSKKYDNGCDPFIEGLSRSQENGKLAYISPNLDTVLKTHYDYGKPFHQGFAIACKQPLEEVTVGDHTVVLGGRCGLIDKNGREVVRPVYTMQQEEFLHHHQKLVTTCIKKLEDKQQVTSCYPAAKVKTTASSQ